MSNALTINTPETTIPFHSPSATEITVLMYLFRESNPKPFIVV